MKCGVSVVGPKPTPIHVLRCRISSVERTEDFAPAYERAAASGKPALIELRIDPDAITPATTLSAIREKSRKAQST